jgi:uncharacterized damage-inducible protein DinB
MISPDHVRLMARYNRWQNESHYREAAKLTDTQRREDRGAYFKSIHGTLSHLVWGDAMWLSRFAGTPKPKAKSGAESPFAYDSFEELHADRTKLDQMIDGWVAAIDANYLAGDLVWFSGITQRELTKPRWIAITHFFNHQTHHRGQVHAMLTSFGAKPDATDVVFMPESS